MNELDSFESELRKLRPARPPEEFLVQLANQLDNLPRPPQAAPRPRPVNPSPVRGWLRWLLPAMAAVTIIVATVSWRFIHAPASSQPQPPTFAVDRPLKADQVEIDQQLVADFDAIAHLSDGELVRVHCRKWADEVVLRDSARGITIERRIPRLEVIPVSFETY